MTLRSCSRHEHGNLEPPPGLEPGTRSLRMSSSTIELQRLGANGCTRRSDLPGFNRALLPSELHWRFDVHASRRRMKRPSLAHMSDQLDQLVSSCETAAVIASSPTKYAFFPSSGDHTGSAKNSSTVVGAVMAASYLMWRCYISRTQHKSIAPRSRDCMGAKMLSVRRLDESAALC